MKMILFFDNHCLAIVRPFFGHLLALVGTGKVLFFSYPVSRN